MQKTKRRRPFLLLEVLISFTLIAFCAIPLIYPHISMIKAQKGFINKVKINHTVNLIYVNILEKLHKNEILLSDIEDKKVFNVDNAELKEINGYRATYQFTSEKHKKRNTAGIATFIVTLQLQFIPKISGKTLTYDYDVFLVSKKEIANLDPNEGGEDEED